MSFVAVAAITVGTGLVAGGVHQFEQGRRAGKRAGRREDLALARRATDKAVLERKEERAEKKRQSDVTRQAGLATQKKFQLLKGRSSTRLTDPTGLGTPNVGGKTALGD